MDSNHDKQIQRLLCYRYTIRQGGQHDRRPARCQANDFRSGSGLIPCPRNTDSS